MTQRDALTWHAPLSRHRRRPCVGTHSFLGARRPPFQRGRPKLLGLVLLASEGVGYGASCSRRKPGTPAHACCGKTAVAYVTLSLFSSASQAVAGAASDRAGRRAPIAAGLFGASIALVLCALGAGGHPEKARPGQQEGSMSQFGYLVVSSSLLGVSQGVMYPVLGAAIADHSEPSSRGSALGAMRFWRDLGYAAGALGAATADGTSPQVSLLLTAAFVAGVGVLVAARFEDVAHGVGPARQVPAAKAAAGSRSAWS